MVATLTTFILQDLERHKRIELPPHLELITADSTHPVQLGA